MLEPAITAIDQTKFAWIGAALAVLLVMTPVTVDWVSSQGSALEEPVRACRASAQDLPVECKAQGCSKCGPDAACLCEDDEWAGYGYDEA